MEIMDIMKTMRIMGASCTQLSYYTRMEMLDIMMTIEEEEMTMWMARWRRAGWWR